MIGVPAIAPFLELLRIGRDGVDPFFFLLE
jgi:hypothetical protein